MARANALDRWKKPLMVGGAAILALDLARRVFRRTQLFSPTRTAEVSWDPTDYGIPADRVEEMWFEADDGSLLHGWYCRAARPIASALYCHGNTGNLTTVAHVMPHLMASGISVFLFDYRGFGRSEGHPSLYGVVADAIRAARFHDRIRPQDVPSILYGFSLGGAIAAQVIRHHAFDGLVLQSTFTNLPDVTRVTFPRIPLHLVAGSFFDTLAIVRRLRIPVLILHGSEDEVCPSWMAQKLFDACAAGPKQLVTIDGGLHKDLYVRDADTLVWTVNRFAIGLPHHAPMDVEPVPAFEHAVDSAFRWLRRQFRRHAVLRAL